LAAFIGALRGVREQIRHTEELERRRNNAENDAARPVLSFALSSVTHYADDCIKAHIPILDALGARPAPTALHTPPLPDDVINRLRDVVRFSYDEQRIDVERLLLWLQVQQSRLQDLEGHLRTGCPTHVITTHEIQARILDAADIYALSARLFPYARRSEDFRPDVSAEEARRALRLNHVWEEEYEDLYMQLSYREQL
jgi:hypothetical protein